MNNSDEQTLLPIGQTARVMRVTSRWLRAEAEAGRVPALRTDNGFLFNLKAVRRVLAERAARSYRKDKSRVT